MSSAMRGARRFSSFPPLTSWASLSPTSLLPAGKPHRAQNLLRGTWLPATRYESIEDPLRGGDMLLVPATSDAEAAAFGESLAAVPKTGLHNPFRAVDRYLMLGRVSAAAGAALRDPATLDYFTRLVQRTSPKSYKEAQVRRPGACAPARPRLTSPRPLPDAP